MWPVSRTGIFHVLFALFFLTFHNPYLSEILSYQAPTLGSNHSDCSLCSQINKNTCIQSHNVVMDMVIFRTIFFELLVFFTFTFLTIHFAC